MAQFLNDILIDGKGTFTESAQATQFTATDGTDLTELRYFGVEFNRSASYLRPSENGNKTLHIGGASQGTNDWGNVFVRTNSSNNFKWNDKVIGLEEDSLAKFGYHYTNGFLVKTEITASSNSMFVLKIFGNGYGHEPFDVTIQGYNYENGGAIVNVKGNSTGINPTVQIFNYDGFLHFHVPQSNPYQSPGFTVHKTNGGNNSKDSSRNVVTSVTNAAVPTSGVTRQVSITPKSTITNFDLPNLSNVAYTDVNNNFSTNQTFQGKVTAGSSSFGSQHIFSSSSDASIEIASSDSNTGIKFLDPDGSTFLFYSGLNDEYDFSNSNIININELKSNSLEVDGDAEFSGNVGIGTTSPGAKLDVSDSIPVLRITGTRDASWAIGQTMASLEYFSEDSSGSSADSVRASINLVNETSVYGSTTGLSFSTKGDQVGSPVEAMRINSSGNVGIGTTSPGAKLEVEGLGVANTPLTLIKAFNTIPYSASNGQGAATIEIGHGIMHGYIEAGSVSETNSAEGYMAFGHRLQANITNEAMRIAEDGNVGIGTSIPTEKLDVDGNATFSGTVEVKGFLSMKYASDITGSNTGTANESYLNFNELGGTTQGYVGFGSLNNSDLYLSNYISSKFLRLKDNGILDYNGNVTFSGTSQATIFIATNGTDSAELRNFGVNFNRATSYLRPSTNGTHTLHIGGSGQGSNDWGSILVKTDSSTDFRWNNEIIATQDWVGSNFAELSGDNIAYTNVDNNFSVGQTFLSNVLFGESQSSESIVTFENSRNDLGNVPFYGLAGKSGGSNVAKISFYRGNGGNSGYLAFSTKQTNEDSLTEKLRIDGSGNVGIGTTNPDAQLEISNNTTTNGAGGASLRLTRKDTTVLSGDPVGKIEFYNTDADGAHVSSFIKGEARETYGRKGALAFGVSQTNSTDAVEAMRIAENGNVGIGTDSPGEKLEINEANTPKIRFGRGTSYYWDIGHTSSDFQFESQTGGTIMHLKYDGNVGIGTTSPQAKLDVDGGIKMADDTATASSSNVGTQRYRTNGNNSYVDMCMQTGASTYEWINIVQNNW